MTERIPTIQADLKNLERRFEDFRAQVMANEIKQEERHDANTRVLQAIQLTLQDFSTKAKIGGFVMHVLWGLAGTVIGALLVKWISRA